MATLRIVFMGTAELSCPSLEGLSAEKTVEIAAVVTQPDRPKGRDLKLQPSPVKELAIRRQLTLLQPQRASEEKFLDALISIHPDLIAVAAYGQILPKSILDLPRFGCLNVHTSLLPKYRGAAPIQWAILNGERETGVTIMKMDAGLDTGAIVARESTAIRDDDNAETLHDRLAKLGADLLVRTIPGYIAGSIVPIPQPSTGISYAHKIKKADGLIDWRLPAITILNRIRAFTPWPGAYTRPVASSAQKTLKLWQAEVVSQSGPPGEILRADNEGLLVACGSDSLRVLVMQREGGRRLRAAEFLLGHSLKPGQQLG